MRPAATSHSPSAVEARRLELDGDAASAERAPGRGLVPIARARRDADECSRNPRPSALFLAQLIATAQQAPQTRARRRAEPADAAAHYAAAVEAGVAGAAFRCSR